MSDKVVDANEKLVETNNKAEKPFSLDEDLKAGYVVGLTTNGDFFWRIVGKDKGLAEILGVHKIATDNLQQLKDAQQGVGDKLVFELTKNVAALTQEVAKLVNLHKKPDNKL